MKLLLLLELLLLLPPPPPPPRPLLKDGMGGVCDCAGQG